MTQSIVHNDQQDGVNVSDCFERIIYTVTPFPVECLFFKKTPKFNLTVYNQS